jgi:cytochrome c oxidase subunit II
MHIHRYEKYWMTFGVFSIVLFILMTGIFGFSYGQHPPSGMDMIDPETVDSTPPFDQPGLKMIRQNHYEANIVAMTFGYKPSKLEIPVGSTVNFRVTSKDVEHSFTIVGTTVNMMVTPGSINEKEYTFKKPGKYLILCNEYCGAGHQMMTMTIEVVKK